MKRVLRTVPVVVVPVFGSSVLGALAGGHIGDDPELASYLRIEERQPEAGGHGEHAETFGSG